MQEKQLAVLDSSPNGMTLQSIYRPPRSLVDFTPYRHCYKEDQFEKKRVNHSVKVDDAAAAKSPWKPVFDSHAELAASITSAIDRSTGSLISSLRREFQGSISSNNDVLGEIRGLRRLISGLRAEELQSSPASFCLRFPAFQVFCVTFPPLPTAKRFTGSIYLAISIL
ncbi:hypothetical protein VTL71DRAFT_5161 [Oculimacula yallundae]|uniref:Uncharacterized protein n=1 Tax=Oculimacula yallundae TaxID=86028 RepID=A0ABR4C0A8_9HELO